MSQLSGEKKRTGFGPHPGGRKAKPDAAGTQFAHGDFSPESREKRTTFRRAIEKADRFWSAPWRAKSLARCGWHVGCARRFQPGVQRVANEDTTTDSKDAAVSASTL